MFSHRDQLVSSWFIFLERGRLRKVIKVAFKVIPRKKKLSNNFFKHLRKFLKKYSITFFSEESP